MSEDLGSAVAPVIDVIVAVHQPTRPIERAVASVLDHTVTAVRVTVVVHNTDAAPIRERLREHTQDPRLRIVEFRDDIPSPAGPMNYGLEIATALYTSLLGSDDELAPGALDGWLAHAEGRRGQFPADMVIAPVRIYGGGFEASPPVRLTHAMLLDGARDRLAYRAAPLGLQRRERFGHIRFLEGVVTGEDQPYTAELWFTPGARIVFPFAEPGYLVHDDQTDRVSFARKTVAEELAALVNMLDTANVWMADPEARLSVLAKQVRVPLFDAVRARVNGHWEALASSQLASVAEMMVGAEPRLVSVLSRNDARLFAAVRSGAATERELKHLLMRRGRLRSFGSLASKDWRFLFHAQAPLRFHLAGYRLIRAVRNMSP